MKIDRRSLLAGMGAAGAVGLGFGHMPAFAQSGSAVGGALSPPSNGSFLLPIIEANGFDKKHGLEELKINFYNDQSILYSDFAAERTNFLISAIFAGANFFARGMDVQLLFTYCTFNAALITRNPEITKFEDLRGKTIYAPTSSGYYGLAALCLQKAGIDLRRDVSLINAPPTGVRTNLLADRADAGLMFDPALSDMLAQGFHLIDDINAGVRNALGVPADTILWGSGITAHKPWLDEDPSRAMRIRLMCEDAINFINTNPADADKLISAFTKLPEEALQVSRDRNISQWRIGLADAERDNLNTLFGAFHQGGFLEQVPGEGYYYDWSNS